ncbi:MAG: hypothetical protein B7Z55_05765 [Planctomycetales bacterium 12-60-4]|nr:MAG: hypothetical protein B7Z55_05765 [Planctomycetales bacterium 12-60-4]
MTLMEGFAALATEPAAWAALATLVAMEVVLGIDNLIFISILSNKLPFKVRVFALGEGETATKLKLMQFKTAPGARVDQTFIHSTYGFRYLTLFVTDIDASIKKSAEKGVKPIGEGVVPLPEGFPEGIFIAVIRDPDGNFVELVGPKGE